jgi:hypothetical protein
MARSGSGRIDLPTCAWFFSSADSILQLGTLKLDVDVREGIIVLLLRV